ncbi:MAG: hypothetical protein IJK08_04460, partial [Prevotella sp.]|nr:hypothetical protein [Prevotella sp.]
PPSSQEGTGEVFFYSGLHFVCRPIRYSGKKINLTIYFAFHSVCTTLPLRGEGRLRFGKESKKLRILLCFSLTLHYLCS